MENKAINLFTWVEIYVDDMLRARKFYETVFEIELTPMEAPGGFGDLEMLGFPWAEGKTNISGALCKTSNIKPSSGGTVVYFTSKDCEFETSRVIEAGGKIIQPKMQIGKHGFYSLVLDTEGNTIGIHSTK